jgi:hypothetical protein
LSPVELGRHERGDVDVVNDHRADAPAEPRDSQVGDLGADDPDLEQVAVLKHSSFPSSHMRSA